MVVRDTVPRPFVQNHAQGYQTLAERLTSRHPQTAIFRRFGDLNAINVLSLQSELAHLQLDLQKLNKSGYASSTAGERNHNGNLALSLLHDEADKGVARRVELMSKIRERLTQYNEALLQISQLNALSRPRKADLQILRDWLIVERQNKRFETEGPEFFTWEPRYEDDLVTTDNRDDQDAFSKWFNDKVVHRYERLFGRWRSKKNVVDVEAGIVHYSDNRLAKISKFIVSIVSSVLPVLAILVLYFVKNTTNRIWITVGMTTLFAVALAGFTSAKHQEIFAATAAFAAVEVVFIGSVNGS